MKISAENLVEKLVEIRRLHSDDKDNNPLEISDIKILGHISFFNFDGITFENVDFSYCVFEACTFNKVTFNNINFQSAKIELSKFENVHLEGANFRNATIAHSCIVDTVFSRCLMARSRVCFSKIENVNVLKSDLYHSYWENCNIFANYIDSDLSFARFKSNPLFHIKNCSFYNSDIVRAMLPNNLIPFCKKLSRTNDENFEVNHSAGGSAKYFFIADRDEYPVSHYYLLCNHPHSYYVENLNEVDDEALMVVLIKHLDKIKVNSFGKIYIVADDFNSFIGREVYVQNESCKMFDFL